VILDTSFLIDIQRGDDAAVAMAEEIEAGDRPRRVPHVVLYELYVGVGKGVQSERTEAKLDEVLSTLPLEPTTPAIARRAGRIEGVLQADGGAVGAVDALVGATALAYGEPVVTADVEDFERMPDVAVVSY
jgi:predicted nucleic acid-binding protein